MAMNYQRKVDEFDILLTEYSKEATNADSTVKSFTVELTSELTLRDLESEKAELYKEQIIIAKDRVKYL